MYPTFVGGETAMRTYRSPQLEMDFIMIAWMLAVIRFSFVLYRLCYVTFHWPTMFAIGKEDTNLLTIIVSNNEITFLIQSRLWNTVCHRTTPLPVMRLKNGQANTVCCSATPMPTSSSDTPMPTQQGQVNADFCSITPMPTTTSAIPVPTQRGQLNTVCNRTILMKRKMPIFTILG